MGRPSIQIEGMKALESRMNALTPEIAVEVRKAINVGALKVKKEAIKMIKRRSSGRRYRRGTHSGSGRKKFHVASAPRNPPNTDTGNLWKNITISKGEGIVTRGYFALVRSRAKYSRFLEEGTKKMKMRPYMKPALNRNKKVIRALIKEAVSGASRFKK